LQVIHEMAAEIQEEFVEGRSPRGEKQPTVDVYLVPERSSEISSELIDAHLEGGSIDSD